MQVESHLPFTVGKYGAKWSDKQQRWEISAPKIGRCGNRKDRGKSLALMEKLAQDDKQAAPVPLQLHSNKNWVTSPSVKLIFMD